MGENGRLPVHSVRILKRLYKPTPLKLAVLSLLVFLIVFGGLIPTKVVIYSDEYIGTSKTRSSLAEVIVLGEDWVFYEYDYSCMIDYHYETRSYSVDPGYMTIYYILFPLAFLVSFPFGSYLRYRMDLNKRNKGIRYL